MKLSISWDLISEKITATEQAQKLQELLLSKLDAYCPLETFKLSSQDKAWINAELKQLNRRKMREWQKRGKTEKYEKLAK